jgi:hypothetical protein
VTPSVTPSITRTPSVTRTITPTITRTPSVTRTITPTITRTPSVTRTPVSPSVTPTVTRTVTQTRTPSVTPTSSITPSVTPTLTPSVSPSCVCKSYNISGLDNSSQIELKSCCTNGLFSETDPNFWKHSNNEINVCACEDNVTITGSGTITLNGSCGDCFCATIEVNQSDLDNLGDEVRVFYQCCNGDFMMEVYTAAGQYQLCNQYIFSVMMFKTSQNLYSLPQNGTGVVNNVGDSGCNCSSCSTTC